MMIICCGKKQKCFVIRTLIYRILCFRQFYDVIVVYLYHQDSFVSVCMKLKQKFLQLFVDQITNFLFRREEKIFTILRNKRRFFLCCCWRKMKIFHCLKIRVIGLEKFFCYFPSFFSLSLSCVSEKTSNVRRYGMCHSLLKIINHSRVISFS